MTFIGNLNLLTPERIYKTNSSITDQLSLKISKIANENLTFEKNNKTYSIVQKFTKHEIVTYRHKWQALLW